jgi:glycosyltransferase involved in cell wall biosynthesis
MVSIIILIYNRPRLTRQTLDSLFASLKNTVLEHEIILVNNGSDEHTVAVINNYRDRAFIHHLYPNRGVAGGKNFGVSQAAGDILYLSDNDMYFLPGWLESMHHTATVFDTAKVLGGFRHPFHNVVHAHTRGSLAFEQLRQAVGSTWYLDRYTWDRFGPLQEGLGVGQDDVIFCDRVTASGFLVGSIVPYKVIHCGAKNTDGKWSPGGHEWHKDPNYTAHLPKGVFFK